MTDTEYNGWTNWDTWATHLWSDNEQATYNKKSALIKAALKHKDKGTYNEARFRIGLRRFYKKVAALARKNGDEVNNKKINWKEIEDFEIRNMEDFR